jgi:hypothetical protein
MSSKFLPYWVTPAMVRAAAVMSGVLFLISYLVDHTLVHLSVAPSATVLNDIAIAVIATGVMLFYLFSTRTEQIFLRAKERMHLTAELNYHLRRALSGARFAAELEDREQRLRILDNVSEEIDHILIELVPTVNGERPPRYTSAARR